MLKYLWIFLCVLKTSCRFWWQSCTSSWDAAWHISIWKLPICPDGDAIRHVQLGCDALQSDLQTVHGRFGLADSEGTRERWPSPRHSQMLTSGTVLLEVPVQLIVCKVCLRLIRGPQRKVLWSERNMFRHMVRPECHHCHVTSLTVSRNTHHSSHALFLGHKSYFYLSRGGK